MPNNDSRVKFAAAQLRGEASTWWMSCTREQQCDSWDQFKELFQANFSPLEAAETARTLLYSIKQSGPVTEYIAAFRLQLHQVMDMNAADQLALFRRGLHESIAWKLNLQRPKTLTEAMQGAQRIEMENQQSRLTRSSHRPFMPMRQSQFNPVRNATPTYHFPSATNFPSSAVPMEISQMENARVDDIPNPLQDQEFQQGQYGLLNAMRMNTRGGAHKQVQNHARGFSTNNGYVSFPPKLSPEDRMKLASENRCFRCRQVGHRATECPMNMSSHSKNPHARR